MAVCLRAPRERNRRFHLNVPVEQGHKAPFTTATMAGQHIEGKDAAQQSGPGAADRGPPEALEVMGPLRRLQKRRSGSVVARRTVARVRRTVARALRAVSPVLCHAPRVVGRTCASVLAGKADE